MAAKQSHGLQQSHSQHSLQSAARANFVGQRKGQPEDHYDILRRLGEGAFGVVHLVQERGHASKSCAKRVMKTVNRARAQMPAEQMEAEINFLRSLDHPHIIRLFEYYGDAHDIHFILEAAEGGELRVVIQETYYGGQWVPEPWSAVVLEQVLRAMGYCHAKGLMHKDLKSENIMLLRKSECETGFDFSAPVHAVIIDLGIAEFFVPRSRRRSDVVAGTVTTMAPEVFKGFFTARCDTWSLGCVLFEMLSGRLPFLAKSMNDNSEWLELHRKGPNWDLCKHVSVAARNLCSRMLLFDERQRPETAECLRHNWFQSAKEPKNRGGGDEGKQGARIETEKPLNSKLSGDHLASMVHFQDRCLLYRAVCMDVAAQLGAGELDDLTEEFRRMDTKGTGMISSSQLISVLQEGLGLAPSEARKAAAALDLSGRGAVEYTEFVAACLGIADERMEEALWRAFKTHDPEGTGFAPISRLRAVLAGIGNMQGVGLRGKDLEDAVKALDRNKDGWVAYDDFREYLLGPCESPTSTCNVTPQTSLEPKKSSLGSVPEASEILVPDAQTDLKSQSKVLAVPTSRRISMSRSSLILGELEDVLAALDTANAEDQFGSSDRQCSEEVAAEETEAVEAKNLNIETEEQTVSEAHMKLREIDQAPQASDSSRSFKATLSHRKSSLAMDSFNHLLASIEAGNDIPSTTCRSSLLASRHGRSSVTMDNLNALLLPDIPSVKEEEEERKGQDQQAAKEQRRKPLEEQEEQKEKEQKVQAAKKPSMVPEEQGQTGHNGARSYTATVTPDDAPPSKKKDPGCCSIS